MDIAGLSVVMANQQLRTDASLKVMGNTKDVMEQQGAQLIEMLQQSTPSTPKAPHPSLGKNIDMKA